MGSRFKDTELGEIEADERRGAEAGAAGGVGCFDVGSFCDGASQVSTLELTAPKVRSRSSVSEKSKKRNIDIWSHRW